MKFIAILITAVLGGTVATATVVEYLGACGNRGLRYTWRHNAPWFSEVCEGNAQGPMCVQLDISHCYANVNGHLVPTKNGQFQRSCKDCGFTGDQGTVFACMCQMFGKGAPWQYTQIDTTKLVKSDNGFLTCWGEGHDKCPGQW